MIASILISTAVSLLQNLVNTHMTLDREQRKGLLEGVKLLEKAVLNTQSVIEDNGYHNFDVYQKQIELSDMWIDVAYSFLPYERDFALLIRNKARMWASPEMYRETVEQGNVPELYNLENVIQQFLFEYGAYEAHLQQPNV